MKNNEESVLLIDLLTQIEPLRRIWLNLEKILLDDSSNDYEFWKSIRGVKILEGYIIIKTGLWNYIIIDPVTATCLTDTECKIIFDEDFFVNYFDEEATDNKFEEMFHFESAGSKKTIQNLIEYIIKYEEVFNQTNIISYSFFYLNACVSVRIRLNKNEVILGFLEYANEIEHPSHVNYIFLNEFAEMKGVSNPTNNRESLLSMGKRAFEIKLPISIIPEFIKTENMKKLLLVK